MADPLHRKGGSGGRTFREGGGSAMASVLSAFRLGTKQF